MTPLMAAGFVTCLLIGSVNLTPPSSLSIESVNVGQDVTLKCVYEDRVGVIFYWYKHAHGQKPQLMSEFLKHKRNGSLKGTFKNNPRFHLETGGNENNMKISNVQMSDAATYFCAGMFAYVYEYLEGITVYVKSSGSTIPTLVLQSASETIHSGASVTLNCSVQTGCDGQQSVYWFKDSDTSHSGIIYTHGGKDDQCTRKPNTQTHTCVYNLPLKNLNVSQAGTYYCAVASCGHILFGDGTKLDFKEKVDSPVLLYVLTGALILSITLLAFLSYKLFKTESSKCKEADPPVVSDSNADVCEEAHHLHYAALSEKRINRSRNQRNTRNDCVYSSVRM